MNSTILVTGSDGLIGTALSHALRLAGSTVLALDLRAAAPADRIDLGHHEAAAGLVAHADGIVHLGAVSRVVEGENDPQRCWSINVDATQNLLAAALASPRRPWFAYASSREVYGQQDIFPVTEDADFRPLNVYARSKVRAEQLVGEARAAGLATAIMRFSSVYGAAGDHRTRVVPAFLRAGLAGKTLQVEGAAHTFDLTYLDDVIEALLSLIRILDGGERALPPIHLASGAGVTLLDLAQRAIALGGNRASLTVTTPRTYDINHFVGSPERAEQLLGWIASTPLDEGLARLAADLSGQLASPAT